MRGIVSSFTCCFSSPNKMDSTTLSDVIHSTLHDLGRVNVLQRDERMAVNNVRRLRFWLLNIKIVLLSATKLCINLNQKSLKYIERVVHEIAEAGGKISDFVLSRYDHRYIRIDKGRGIYMVLLELTEELYAPLRDAPRRSSSFTIEESLEFIYIFQENMKNLLDLGCISSAPHDALKTLGEQMMFIKSLILFAIQRHVEPKKDLLDYAGAVAIDAALLLVDYEFSREKLMVSTLIQKIKPIHPEIYKIYTEALTMARSLPPTDQGTNDVTPNFLSSLVSIFFEELARSTDVSVAMMEQLHELYEGLRCLRQTFLKHQPNNLDLNIKQDIFNLVCDVGIFICSFQQSHKKIDSSIVQELLDAIKIILSNLGEKHAQVPTINSGCTMLLAFLDCLSEKHMALTNGGNLTFQIWAWIRSVIGELANFRSFLGDILGLPNDHDELQTLIDRIFDVAHRVEDVFDYLRAGKIPYSISDSFYSIKKDIDIIKSEIKDKKRSIIKIQIASAAHSQVQSTTPSMTKEIVAFHDHESTIINRLTRGSKNLRIVGIVGMAGVGKTTLAEKVYSDPSVSYHFSVRAFTTVSQTFDKKSLLLDLLKQVDPDKHAQISSDKSADDVADKLRRSLKGKRYLIVLDDIWEARAWQQFQGSFPDDSKGSRIVVTSRYHDVIASPDMLDDKPFELRPLNENKSLDLLQRQLFGGYGRPTELGNLLMQIVQVCNGLPLTIIVVAGLLRSMKPEDWKTIVDSLTSGNLSERCRDTLELSYRHLPEHLKPCLLYFATFQEDEHVSVERLISLWMAEGFIRKVEMKGLSDVAEGYLHDLIGRSLVMVAKRTSMGRVKRCRIHDLLYEFCLKQAKEEQFFHFLEEGYGALSGFSESHLQRLCISSGANDFIESKVFCPNVHSLRFKYLKIQDAPSLTPLMHMCKLVGVLDLEHIVLDCGIPSEIGQLVRLTYLAIRTRWWDIPESIGNLSVLETLKLIVNSSLDLPESLWNLQKLKHLSFSSSTGYYFEFGKFNLKTLDNSYNLYEVDTIFGVQIPYGAVERVLKKFPNLRHLKFGFSGTNLPRGTLGHIVVPDILTQLESLLLHRDPLFYNEVDFSLPTNIKKLTLEYFNLSGTNCSSIGILPNLEYLYLSKVQFEGDTWIMEEEQFSKLRILKLDSFTLRWWSSSDDQLGCLEKLVLCNCLKLEEMPSCLEIISTLQQIKATRCPETVTKMVQDIGKAQADYGNTDLKIIIS